MHTPVAIGAPGLAYGGPVADGQAAFFDSDTRKVQRGPCVVEVRVLTSSTGTGCRHTRGLTPHRGPQGRGGEVMKGWTCKCGAHNGEREWLCHKCGRERK